MSEPTAPVAGLGAADVSEPARAALFGPGRRATTVGLVLLTLVTAFEAMGVGTAMPAVIADLSAVSAYGWPFTAFLAASVLGTVLGGRWCDVAGPRAALLVTPLVFAAGLVVAGTAGTMAQLLIGRVLQGGSAGTQFVAVYVAIAAVYPERSRPALFGLISAAWVLPSLIGPPVAALVTEQFSWHWVFLGLVPFVVVALALVVPGVRRLRRSGPPAGTGRGLVAAAAGAALGVTAVSWAGQHPDRIGGITAVAALAVLVPALRRLLPAGVFHGGRGIPTVVAARGLIAGVFFAGNSYLPLILTATHGWSLTAAGVPLVVAALGWAAASAWQGRHPDLPRTTLLRVGFGALAVGVAGLLAVTPAAGPAWVAVPAWTVAGVGMGLGYSAVSYLLLHHSQVHQVGSHTAAAQVADQLTTATLVGLGGALLAVLATPATALTVLLVPLVVLAVLGALLAPRAG
ncbi:MFS transporter [Pseudonocardia charpentierae]|uniref:MFS transporter n=1 Tax=Pseudonocardia charpentierae TaxID=3075545 RepID=A0ABU2NDN5_9PSEU|nr:MFS transporter [Pseudonocardia sp. DSM 45834]MDT0351841.1 MFS transporter [Pseudonocardia sp. DSM 45834]